MSILFQSVMRSLYITADVKKGDVFTEGNVRSIRPGYGMHPAKIGKVLGEIATDDIKAGTPLSKYHVEKWS